MSLLQMSQVSGTANLDKVFWGLCRPPKAKAHLSSARQSNVKSPHRMPPAARRRTKPQIICASAANSTLKNNKTFTLRLLPAKLFLVSMPAITQAQLLVFICHLPGGCCGWGHYPVHRGRVAVPRHLKGYVQGTRPCYSWRKALVQRRR